MTRGPGTDLRSARHEAGLTLIELLVAVGLSAVAAGFAFAIYAKTSVAYRSQQRVAEVQQTLRAASDLLLREVRQTGFMLAQFRAADLATPGLRAPITVDNNAEAEGSDAFTIAYVDGSAGFARVLDPFLATSSHVDDASMFQVGDVVVAAIANSAGPPDRGEACTLMITGLSQRADLTWDIAHADTAAEIPWGRAGHPQCVNFDGLVDQDNDTTDVSAKFATSVSIARLRIRTYRIAPGDARGVLQMSPSGQLVANDWVDLVTGIADLQVALRVFDPTSVIDLDLDGDFKRNWFSGDNMELLRFTKNSATDHLLQVRISLVARTTSQIDAVMPATAPQLTNPIRPLVNNDIGDHPGIAVPAAAITSRYYGTHLYRWSSTIVDVRNMAIGD